MIHRKQKLIDRAGGGTPDPQARVNGERILLKVGDVAGLLSCSTRLVWRLASEGRIPRVVLGLRCVRFRRRDVELLVEELASE